MFFKSNNDECKVCDAKNDFIRYLKNEIERLTKTIENERAEYKRAVDVSLIKNNLPPVGQGVTKEMVTSAPMSIQSLWDEVKEPGE